MFQFCCTFCLSTDPNKPLTKNQKKREAKKAKGPQEGQV